MIRKFRAGLALQPVRIFVFLYFFYLKIVSTVSNYVDK